MIVRDNNNEIDAHSEFEQFLIISCTYLDLHANMLAIDQNLIIAIDAGWEVEVSYFNLDCKVLSKPRTVETIVRHDSMHTGVTCLSKVRKNLNVLAMNYIIVCKCYERGRPAKKCT